MALRVDVFCLTVQQLLGSDRCSVGGRRGLYASSGVSISAVSIQKHQQPKAPSLCEIVKAYRAQNYVKVGRMKIISKLALAAAFLWWVNLGISPAVAQAYYYYYSGNAWVYLPHHGQPRPFFPYGRAYYGDPFCYPQYRICCPRGFILRRGVCQPIGW